MIELATAQASSAAPPQEFFERWVDHATWGEWSPDTEWARVDGPVRAGAHGVLKPKGGPKTKFTVSECEPGRVYTDISRLPGARLTFRHTAERAAAGPGSELAGSELTVRVWLDGPLSWLWARTAFRGFATSGPADLARLIMLVERPREHA